MWKRFWFKAIILNVLGFYACKTEETSPNVSTDNFRYFPVDDFPTKIFLVEDIRFRIIDKPDTNTYFLKEQLADTLILPNGQRVRRIQTFVGATKQGPWTMDSAYVIWNDNGIAFSLGNNQTKRHLMFPPSLNKTWSFMPQPNNQFINARLRGFGVKFNLGDTSLSNCLLVSTFQDSSCVGKSLAYEVFAPTKGLVYAENTQLSYGEPCNPPNFIVLSGFKYRKYLLIGE